MKGFSGPQIGLLCILGLSLLATLIAILLEAWRVAAAGAVVSFGVFSVLVVFTLIALKESVQRTSGLVRATNPRIRETAAGVRRLDNRTADRFKTLDFTEARIESAERRLLATLETHRFELEDEVAELKQKLQGPNSSQS